MENEPNFRKKVSGIVEPLIYISGRIIRHLNPAGIKDQFNKIYVEGFSEYFLTRFGLPLKSLVDALVNPQNIERWKLKSIDLGPLKYIDCSTFETRRKQLSPYVILFPKNSYLYYIHMPEFKPIVSLESTNYIEKEDEALTAFITPPTYQEGYKHANLSELGVAIVSENGTETILEFRDKTDDVFGGGMYLSEDGKTFEIYNFQDMMLEVSQKKQPGYIIQANWYIGSENFPYRYPTAGLKHRAQYNALGIYYFPDGSSQIFTVQLYYNQLMSAGVLANMIKKQIGAVSWKLAGLEFSSGGTKLAVNDKSMNMLGVTHEDIKWNYNFPDLQDAKFIVKDKHHIPARSVLVTVRGDYFALAVKVDKTLNHTVQG